MRLLKKSVVALVAMSMVAGCSGGSDVASSDKTELSWWVINPPSPTAAEAQEKMIADFEAENPDIKITKTNRAIDAHKDSLRTSIGTSAAPDIYDYWAGPGLGGELVERGASEDISSYYTEYKWPERFTEAAMGPVTQYGGHHGVPWKLNGEAMFYNKALFEKAGITELPTTLDELNDAAAKLKDAGITPIEFGGTVNWHVMRLLDTFLEGYCGSETFDKLVTNQANWGEEECVTESFVNLEKWASDYFNPGFIGINNDEASSLFFTGEAAMALEGDWFNAQLADNAEVDNFGVFALPTGTGRMYGFEQAMYITKDSDSKDAAAKFLDFMMSEPVQEETLGLFASQSVNKNVTPTADDELSASWNEIFENAEGLYMNNDQNLTQAQTTEYWRIQNLVVTGALDPEEAGSEFQKFLDSSN